MYNSDFYEFLGVSPNANAEEIKKAYHKKSFEYHPDHGGSNEKMRTLNYIYEVLSDPVKRRSYDSSRHYYRSDKDKHSYSDAGQKNHERKEKPEDYSKAVFVNGIEAQDASGNIAYIKLHDFIYYPATVKNKILFWEYNSTEFYRAKVLKIYSAKRNNFRKVPLFVVDVESLEQVIFRDDYSKLWLNETSYNKAENKKAWITAIKWASGIAIALVVLFNISRYPDTATESNSRSTTPQTSTGSCVIKGNISISSGEKIYHMPSDTYYEETVINESFGERWFCSENEARSAGWRRARS